MCHSIRDFIVERILYASKQTIRTAILESNIKISLFHFDEYDMWVSPVTVIFLTYATSSIRTVWGGSNETVFLSALIKKSKEKKTKQKLSNFKDYPSRTLSLL